MISDEVRPKTRVNPCSRACRRNCQAGFWSVVFQGAVGIAVLVAALYAAALILEPLKLTGISTTPPGILYVPYQQPDD